MTIDRIATGGVGVGRANGLACFVPRTAPGDLAQVAYVAHARHGRGRVLQIVTPSAHRGEARRASPHRAGCAVSYREAHDRAAGTRDRRIMGLPRTTDAHAVAARAWVDGWSTSA